MKKYLLVSLLAFSALLMRSQISNPGFENLSTDGHIKNWGMPFFTVVMFDSNGVAHTDSIVFDQQLYFSTADAHSGTKALEMRNAYNYTAGHDISGAVRLMSNDSDYAAFASMHELHQRPASFSFYYKFAPVNSDTAYAYMTIYDSLGYETGASTIEISAPAGNYALAIQPVQYSSPNPSAFVEIHFATAKPGTAASFGTRFLVDDVNLIAQPTGISEQAMRNAAVQLFPNPVQDIIHINLRDAATEHNTRIEIRDLQGAVVKEITLSGNEAAMCIDASQLAKGMYTISLNRGGKTYSRTFIK